MKRRDEARTQEILKKVRRVEIGTRKMVDSILSGQYHTRFKGQGMQFADLREYYLGDDIRHIDWKVTARTQSAHVKKFEEERELTVYFVVDMSASGNFGSSRLTKQEALSEVCALLAFAAVRNNDKVGLILFTDKVEAHIPPKKGKAHALRLLTELLYFEPEGKKTSVAKAADACLGVMKSRGVVFLASDFFDEDYEPSLKRLARKHDLIALRMRDLREVESPPVGTIEMIDAETGRPYWINTKDYSFFKDFKSRAQSFERDIQARFLRAGAERLDLWTHEDYFKKVVSFFRDRKRGRR